MLTRAGVLLVATLTMVTGAYRIDVAGQGVEPTTVVRGVVIRADSRQPISGVSVSINLSGASPVTTDAQGRFTFERVPPGRYNVFAYPDGFIASPDEGNRARIAVAATPVDVALVLRPFASISGTVRDPDGRRESLSCLTSRKGHYDVELDIYYPYPPGEYLADIRQNGRSILDSGVTITQQPPARIDVIFEPGAATITGGVRDASNQPTFDRVVVLLSRAQGRRRVVHSQMVSADFTGAYAFANVAPGDYLVFAPTTMRDWKNASI